MMITEKELAKAKPTKEYLIGKTILQKSFHPTFPTEYEVCVFCWAQFSGFEEDLQEGFCEPDTNSWICPRCLDRYTNAFEWNVVFRDSGIVLEPYSDDYLDD